MFWFLLFIAFLIFAPLVLFLTGIAVALFIIPFFVFFGVWAAFVWLTMLTLPAFFRLGMAVGLFLAIGSAFTVGHAVTRRSLPPARERE